MTNNYWIDDFELSLAPDISSLIDRSRAWEKHQKALVIGDPATYKKDPDFTFPDLPGAREEARQVAEIWGTEAIIGDDASLKIIKEKISDTSIFHVAAHGIANTETPLRDSFIALQGQSKKHSRLTGLEILNHDLEKMNLVILSACQSGLGYQHDQGTIGLARAFYMAGSSRVLMSLWNVDDEATEMLMTHFHRFLKDQTPASALRNAMLKTRKTYPNISQWASFLLFGESR